LRRDAAANARVLRSCRPGLESAGDPGHGGSGIQQPPGKVAVPSFGSDFAVPVLVQMTLDPVLVQLP